MAYDVLKKNLTQKMRMSHIYQPGLIKHYIRNGGRSNDVEIAKDISLQDPTQIEYYQNITNNMVGRVLRSHNIISKEGRSYELEGFADLTAPEITELINICNEKLEQYIAKRGSNIWQHRSRSRGHIPGSIKYPY